MSDFLREMKAEQLAAAQERWREEERLSTKAAAAFDWAELQRFVLSDQRRPKAVTLTIKAAAHFGAPLVDRRSVKRERQEHAPALLKHQAFSTGLERVALNFTKFEILRHELRELCFLQRGVLFPGCYAQPFYSFVPGSKMPTRWRQGI